VVTPFPSEDTRATLLLVVRLATRSDGAQPLTARQYATLTRSLEELGVRPADLLTDHGYKLFRSLTLPEIPPDHVQQLLNRDVALFSLVKQWTDAGIWIIGKYDDAYPQRYASYLGKSAPPIVYGIGEHRLLQERGLAIVGSRYASEDELECSRRLGVACADQAIAVISGAAKGVDSQSMIAAIEHQGTAVAVLAEGLGLAVDPDVQEPIAHGQLTLISPYQPGSQWLPYTAMARNKLIYALADAAVVVASSDEQGGTWTGAVEAIKRGVIPIYVKTSPGTSSGNRKLIDAGGLEFPSGAEQDLTQLFQRSPRIASLFPDR
jgi:predicted Rossmann fold nucleotide-binding protein DprA/Smf involved in DNA uptake